MRRHDTRGADETKQLMSNVEDQLNRLLMQMNDLEELREAMQQCMAQKLLVNKAREKVTSGPSEAKREEYALAKARQTLLEEDWTRTGEPGPTERRSLKRVRTLQREVSRLEGILDDVFGLPPQDPH